MSFFMEQVKTRCHIFKIRQTYNYDSCATTEDICKNILMLSLNISIKNLD